MLMGMAKQSTPAPADRQEQEVRREQIRSLAAKMFFERGYDATTMRGIAADLGIQAASLYYHFPDKEQILFDLIESVQSQLMAGAESLMNAEEGAELKLAAIVVNHVTLHALRPKETTLGDTELRSLTGERLDVNLAQRDAYEALVVRVLRAGAREGRFDVLDAKLSAYAIIAQSSNVGIWYQDPGRLSLERVAEIHVALALRMVGAEAVARRDVTRLVRRARELHAELR